MDLMTDLAERYGRGPRSTRPTTLVLAVGALAGLVLIAVTVWAFLDQADPEVRSTLQTYDVRSEHEVVAELVVVRSGSGVRATCNLHAVAEDHSTVGRASRTVESGTRRQVLEVTIATERRAVSVVSDGCTTPDQRRPR